MITIAPKGRGWSVKCTSIESLTLYGFTEGESVKLSRDKDWGSLRKQIGHGASVRAEAKGRTFRGASRSEVKRYATGQG